MTDLLTDQRQQVTHSSAELADNRDLITPSPGITLDFE